MKALLSLLLFVSVFNPAKTVNRLTNDDKMLDDTIIEGVLTYISKLEETELSVNAIEPLFDVENTTSYFLLQLNRGYAIVGKNGVISEYCLGDNFTPNDIVKFGKKYYCGPFNYLTQEEYAALKQKDVESLAKINEASRRFLASTIEYNTCDTSEIISYTISSLTWNGSISEGMAARYSPGKWINNTVNYPSPYPSAGICGTISSAALLAFYDDFVTGYNPVPDSIRNTAVTGIYSPGNLITTLYSYIDALHPGGTLYNHLTSGINSFLTAYSYCSSSHQANGSIPLTFGIAKNKIDASRPVVIGLLTALGSTYGDHWVLAYQYHDEFDGQNDFYKCVDNHGYYNKAIHVAWSSAVVYLSN